jgi:hypothetical protein
MNECCFCGDEIALESQNCGRCSRNGQMFYSNGYELKGYSHKFSEKKK